LIFNLHLFEFKDNFTIENQSKLTDLKMNLVESSESKNNKKNPVEDQKVNNHQSSSKCCRYF